MLVFLQQNNNKSKITNIYKQHVHHQAKVSGDPSSSLTGKTIVITGASHGIGLAAALRCARYNCLIAILAKTATLHPKLPGTIYTASKQIEEAGGKALPIVCGVRSEEAVKQAIEKTISKFGGY